MYPPNIALPGDDQFDLKNWPFYWLVKANGHYTLNLEKALKTIELDIPRWRVLMLLEGDRARSISYLAHEAITKLSTMTRIIQRMKKDDLVDTQPRSSDQRVTEVILSPHGRRARILALQKADSMYTKAFSGFTIDEINTLIKLLRQVHKNLDFSTSH